MLSGIQMFLEKNRKWLFSFLLVVIVVPFVFTIGNMPGLVGRKYNKNLKLFGYDLNDRRQVEEVVRNGAISIALQTGSEENSWMESAQGYAFYRLLLLNVAQELQLPAPSEDALQTYIKTRPLFQDKSHQFQVSTYNTYLENWKKSFGKTQSLRNLMIEDYLCNQVRNVILYSSFCLSQECENFFKNSKAVYELNYMAIKNNEPIPENIHEEALRKYYDEHKEDYRVGQRADVSLLFFENKKYAVSLPEISEKDLEKYYNDHKDSFKENNVIPEFKDIRDRVESTWETEQLNRLAMEEASLFSIETYEKNLVMNSDSWKQVIDKRNIRCINSIEPYSKDTVPEKKGLSKQILLKAFDLNETHFLSDPMQVRNGVVLLALNKFLPSYIPEMDVVRSKVIEDAKNNVRQKAFDKKVEDVSKYLETSDLEAIGKNENFEVKSLEKFSIESGFSELIKLLSFQAVIEFSQTVHNLPLNAWSKAYNGNDETVVFFYCKDKKFPENFKDTEEYKRFSENFELRQRTLGSETLLREILEDAMNTLQPRR